MIASDIDGYWGEMEVDYHSALQDGIPSPPTDPANMGGQSHLSQKYGSKLIDYPPSLSKCVESYF